MTPFALLLNLIWIVFGGLEMALLWVLAGLLLAVTIIGLPWAGAAFMLARYTLAPFGSSLERRDRVKGRATLGTGPLGFIGNLVWLVLCGWWLALGHVLCAIACALTIIGLPFAWAHLKLAEAALMPIGMAVVPLR